jgi:hypothetical protein
MKAKRKRNEITFIQVDTKVILISQKGLIFFAEIANKVSAKNF